MYSKNDPMKAYMQDIGEIPLISKEEEIELAALIKIGDEPARQKLIKANLRLVVKIAHDFKGFGLPLLDLISEGNIGLMRAAEKFDPSKGAKFSSYSAWWIKQSMRRALSQKSRTIRVPVASAGKINKIRTAKIQLSESLGRGPTDVEIAEHLDLTKRTVQGLKLADFKTFSLHDPIQKGEEGSFEDIIPDIGAATPDDIAECKENIERLRALIQRLDQRERVILIMRYGLDGSRPQTLEEVSKVIGRTRERVRQIQMQSLKKLRGMIEDDANGLLARMAPFLAALEKKTRGGFNSAALTNTYARLGLRPGARRINEDGDAGLRAGQVTALASRPPPWTDPEVLGYQQPQLARCHFPVMALKLSTRSYNSLRSAGIETVAQLAQKTSSELLTIRYFGEKCLAEVQSAVSEYAECVAAS